MLFEREYLIKGLFENQRAFEGYPLMKSGLVFEEQST